MFFLNFWKQKSFYSVGTTAFFTCVFIGLICSSRRPPPGDNFKSYVPVIFKNGILGSENSFERCLLGLGHRHDRFSDKI